jgi:tetratricopeptide (TPR) repeat protein
LAVPGSAAAEAVAPALPGDVPGLIRALADADPELREKAADRLVQIGPDARDEVLAATDSDDPEISLRAGYVLMKLPWHREGDSPLARQALLRYGRFNELERKQVVKRLADAREAEVLVRLLVEEPADNVRWEIARRLSEDTRPATAELLRVLPLDRENAAALVATARAWLAEDLDKGLALYRRAIELERSRPSDDLGQMRQPFHALMTAAYAANDADGVADLLRLQTERGFGGDDTPEAAVAALFALHAYHGPLRGYGRDLRTYGSLVGRPTVVDEIALLMNRLGVGGIRPVHRAAYRALPLSAEARHAGARFLMFFGRGADARGELDAVLAAAQREQDPAIEVDVHYRLAAVAMDRDEHAVVANELRRVMELMEKHRLSFRDRRPEDVWGEIHWREYKSARANGDAVNADRLLAELIKLPPAHADAILDVVDALEKTGRKDEAERVFDVVYDELKRRIKDEPAEVNHANNLAWMLSRMGRRPAEAVELSQRAIAAEPTNPAYLDTAAEAEFRAGNVDEAIRLETKALQLRPHDKFMRDQLERFRAARTHPKPNAPG